MSQHGERGFSLLETLVAVSLLAVSVCALAQLFAIAVRATADARHASMAAALAEQKLEELRRPGLPLTPQPATSLDSNTAGLCDFLDQYGRALGTGTVPMAGTIYVRRWSITPLPADPAGSTLLQVVVIPRFLQGAALSGSADPRRFGGAQLVAIKTRRAG
jgi:prepilin-type N-terminal cleavage/methylation domain-containing protein